MFPATAYVLAVILIDAPPTQLTSPPLDQMIVIND